MRAWLFAPLVALATVLSCEDRCDRNENVGGSSALHPIAHVHMQHPETLFGSDRAVAETIADVLGVDRYIADQGLADAPLDVLVGVGVAGLEAHVAMRARADAQIELAKRYDVEPLLFEQFRIKTRVGAARCLLLEDHLTCASPGARVGRGGPAVHRLAKAYDAGTQPVLHVRVTDGAGVAESLVPYLRVRLQEIAEGTSLERALGELDWTVMAEAIGGSDMTMHLEKSDTLVWEIRLPMRLPASLVAVAPKMVSSDGAVVDGATIGATKEMRVHLVHADGGARLAVRLSPATFAVLVRRLF